MTYTLPRVLTFTAHDVYLSVTMEDAELRKELKELAASLNKIKEKKWSAFLFERVLPVMATIFLGAAGIMVSMNQTKISELQVQLQANAQHSDSLHRLAQTELQKNQNEVDLDKQYIDLIYDDIVSGDDKRVNAALKLIKKMRPEVGKAFLEILEEQNSPTQSQKYADIEEIQIKYSKSLAYDKITIGIHRLSFAQEDQLALINKWFKDKSYELIGNFYHKNRTSWMATQSTVFYYGDQKSKDRAAAIAEKLQEITNIKFATALGAGLGVDKDRRDYHHFIHFINE
ncbi:MAG: hypothetical protein AAGF85_20255 [Bacteroidota bacterium]